MAEKALLTVESVKGVHFAPVSLQVAGGEVLALYGASGSGKTQFLRALADLEPHQGTIALDGVAQESMPAHVWRRQVAYLPAEPAWWAAGVLDHFTHAPQEVLLSQLHLPPEIMQRAVDGLSSGERQRLGLLRLMQFQPQVLLLDEPTANLDAESTRAVEGWVLDYARQHRAAVLWVTHDAAQRARIATRSIEVYPRSAS